MVKTALGQGPLGTVTATLYAALAAWWPHAPF